MLTHRHVEVFRALMIAGSVTRAAELLHTSQPTVSRELARMEHSIGFPLFERIRGRLRPTMQRWRCMTRSGSPTRGWSGWPPPRRGCAPIRTASWR